MLIEYNDCCAINYVNGQAYDNAKDFVIDFDLINGRTTELTILAKRRKNGSYKVVEVLFDKNLSEQDVQDLSEIYWYILNKKERGKKLQPIIDVWEFDKFYLIACERGQATETIDGAISDYRQICYWKNNQLYNGLKKVLELTDKIYINFYTFDEYFKRFSFIPYKERGETYARNIRNIRTIIRFCKENNKKAELKLVNTEKAFKYIKEHKLKNDEATWADLASSDIFDDMPDIFCECSEFLQNAESAKLMIKAISHLPNLSENIDCISAVVHDDKKIYQVIKYWINPLYESEILYNKIIDDIFEKTMKYNIKEVEEIKEVMPFESCQKSGELKTSIKN